MSAHILVASFTEAALNNTRYDSLPCTETWSEGGQGNGRLHHTHLSNLRVGFQQHSGSRKARAFAACDNVR